MFRLIAFIIVGIFFGACVGCVAGLIVCYVINEFPTWRGEPPQQMPLAQIIPICAVTGVAGAATFAVLEYFRFRPRAAGGNDRTNTAGQRPAKKA
jgi:MFS family permease